MSLRRADHQLVMAAFEGELGSAEFDELQRRLKTEPELLALYREHAMLHHSLAEEFEGRHSIGETVPFVSRGPRWLLPLVAVAVIGAISFAAWKFTRNDNPAAPITGPGVGKALVAPGSSGVGASVTLLEDNFDSGIMETDRRPQQGDSHWRLERGKPTISGGYLEGSGFEAYFYLPAEVMSVERPLMLVTVETVAGSGGNFHTSGWAGFSLYEDRYEVCFFGDSYGPEKTWSLDVKRSLVPLMPTSPVTGPRVMTFRYDRRDGTVEIYEGPEPTGEPLVRSKIQSGLKFDQIRIGASQDATLALTSLRVRVAEPKPR